MHRKISTWVLVVCALLVLAFLVRTCTRHHQVSHDIYSIARDVTWYPLNLMDKERSLVAFSEELMVVIAKEERFKYSWVNIPYGDLFIGLREGNYDAILSFIEPTLVNKETYQISNIILETGPVLIVPNKSSVRSLEDLSERTVGLSKGTNIILKSKANYFIKYFDNMNQALDQLAEGNVDAVIMDFNLAQAYIQSFYPDTLKIVSPPLVKDGLRLITLKDGNTDQLIEKFNHGLEKIKNDGTLALLLSKWGLINPESYVKP